MRVCQMAEEGREAEASAPSPAPPPAAARRSTPHSQNQRWMRAAGNLLPIWKILLFRAKYRLSRWSQIHVIKIDSAIFDDYHIYT